MFVLKLLAMLLLSAQLALAALEINVEEPTDWPGMSPEVNTNVDDTADITGAGETFLLPSVPVAATINIQDKELTPKRAVDCSASSANAGLGHLLREAKSILPLSKIQQLIVDSAANDQQVSDLLALQRSEGLRKLVDAIKQSFEYRFLREYACRQLQLDLPEMVRFIKNFISLSKEQVKPSVGEFKGRPGIRGLFQDIRSILPRQQLRDMYQQLMEQDSQLSAAVQRIKSSEFRQLLRNLRLLPELKELREQLLNVGVPLVEFKELINAALGWTGDEFGDNGKNWKI